MLSLGACGDAHVWRSETAQCIPHIRVACRLITGNLQKKKPTVPISEAFRRRNAPNDLNLQNLKKMFFFWMTPAHLHLSDTYSEKVHVALRWAFYMTYLLMTHDIVWHSIWHFIWQIFWFRHSTWYFVLTCILNSFSDSLPYLAFFLAFRLAERGTDTIQLGNFLSILLGPNNSWRHMCLHVRIA